MGTSVESSRIKNVFMSINEQLDEVFGIEQEAIAIQNNAENIDARDKFVELLNRITQRHPNTKIVIFLDSIDQLSQSDYSLDWMLYELPVNVKIVFTVLLDYKGITGRIKVNQSNYVRIDDWSKVQAAGFIKSWLANVDRTLSQSQFNYLNNEILNRANNLYPLHTKLLFNICAKLSSQYDFSDDFNTCLTTKDTIKYFFRKNEDLYGTILFSRCVFYLTIFEYNGISDSELEDILSIDDDVLTSVLQYHHPPVRRFPIALWLRIKYEIKDYLTEKESDGILVTSWFHRTFIEAANEYYNRLLSRSDEKDLILCNIIDYFTEKWNRVRSDGTKGASKDFTYTRFGLHEFDPKPNRTNDTEYTAYRWTKSQKLIYESTSNDGASVMHYNKRKLYRLFDLILMLNNDFTKVELLLKHVYLDYGFIYARAKLRDLDFVIDTHEVISNLKFKIGSNSPFMSELFEVSQIYKENYANMQRYPNALGFTLLSRLESRSDLVRGFYKNDRSHLILQKKYIEREEEDIKTIFTVPTNKKILKLHRHFSLPLVAAETVAVDEYNKTTIYMINYATKKVIRKLSLKINAEFTQIYLESQPNSDGDMDGVIYFSLKNFIYFCDFSNNTEKLSEFKSDIKELILLNKTHLITFLSNSIHLIRMKNNRVSDVETVEALDDNESIISIDSTLTKQIIYSDSEWDFVSYIVIGLSNGCLNVYRYDNKTSDLLKHSQINEYKDCVIPNTIHIDHDFSLEKNVFDKQNGTAIDKCIENRQHLTFAIEDESTGVIHVYKITGPNQYVLIKKLDEASKKKMYIAPPIYAQDKSKLYGFFNNTLVFHNGYVIEQPLMPYFHMRCLTFYPMGCYY